MTDDLAIVLRVLRECFTDQGLDPAGAERMAAFVVELAELRCRQVLTARLTALRGCRVGWALLQELGAGDGETTAAAACRLRTSERALRREREAIRSLLGNGVRVGATIAS